MPRVSLKNQFLAQQHQKVLLSSYKRRLRFYLDMEDEDHDEIDFLQYLKYKHQCQCRYIFRTKYRKKESAQRCNMLLYGTLLNETEFKAMFRMSRELFFRLNNKLKDDPILKSIPGCERKGSPELHLMVLLKFLGANGNENTALKNGRFFMIVIGTVYVFLERMIKVILKHELDELSWPDESERKSIGDCIWKEYGFKNCIGFIDGTLFPFECKPTLNGEDYLSRKWGYTINALITSDHDARIRDIVIGWPGSVHDNRVWKNSILYNEQNTRFNSEQYLLGDSAFEASSVLVPSYKKPCGAVLEHGKEFFNTKLAKARIRSEHCIGLLKGRFQLLNRMRIIISCQQDMIQMVRIVKVCCIIHNWLVRDPDPIPDGWIDIEHYERDIGEAELDEPIPETAEGNVRREKLLGYILEMFNQ